jgi:hypothetical protein
MPPSRGQSYNAPPSSVLRVSGRTPSLRRCAAWRLRRGGRRSPFSRSQRDARRSLELQVFFARSSAVLCLKAFSNPQPLSWAVRGWGGDGVIKRLLAFVLLLSTVSILAPPVLSIGPRNAVKNPHVTIEPEGAEALLPSRGVLEWVAEPQLGALDFVHMLDASKVHFSKARVLTLADLTGLMMDPEDALEAEKQVGIRYV